VKLTLDELALALARAVYQEPETPKPGTLLTMPETTKERQSYRNGYYSVRDLPEFQNLVKHLKEVGLWT
jgi:hypothetical protein